MRHWPLTAFVATLGLVGQQGAPLGQTHTLLPGVAVEGVVRDTGASFTVLMTTGDAAEIEVSQPRGDLRLRALDPNGEELVRANMRRPAQGNERLLFVARTDGAHVVRVESASSQPAEAPFAVTLTALRPSTDADRAFAEAVKTYAAAERDLALGTGEARTRALAGFRQSLDVWKAQGARYEQAAALQQIGLAHMQAANLAEGVATLEETARLRREIGDPYGEGVALHNLASTHHRRGDYEASIKFYAKALELRRQVGDRGGEAWTLIGQGASRAITSSGWQPAIPLFQQALDIFKEVRDGRGESEALYYLGYAHTWIGDYDRALTFFEAALALRRNQKDFAGQASALNQILAAHRSLGDAERALELVDETLALRRVAGDKRGEAYTLQTAAMAATDLGDYETATVRLQEARALFDAVGDREGQASVLNHLARVHLMTGKLETARELAAQALVIGEQRTAITPTLLSLMGRIQYARGAYAEASSFYERALAESRRTGQPLMAATALSGWGRTAQAQGDLETAVPRLREAIRLIESVRASVAQQDARSALLALTQGSYEWTIEALMARHRTSRASQDVADALAFSERRRARSLLELLAEARIDMSAQTAEPLAAREASLQRQLNEKAAELMKIHSEGAHDRGVQLQKEVDALVADHRAARAELRRQDPRYAGLVHPEPLELAGIQQLLDPGTLLLEYSLGDDRSYVWAVTPDTLIVRELPGRSAIENAARQAHRLATDSARRTAQPAARRALRELSAMILKPVAAELRDKRLVIVADGALQYVPFAALPDPVRSAPSDTPLVVAHEIVMLPSASTLQQLRADRRRSTEGATNVAVLADPVLRPDDPRVAPGKETDTPVRDRLRAARRVGLADFDRLPHTRDEAVAIAGMVGASNSRIALGFEANRELALSPDLGRYRILHFATHTLLDTRKPELSGIVLTLVDRDGRRVDGFVRLHDILKMRLDADLVVLSACETALGRDVKGEGLVGLTRGFMYAGAPQIVASLWNVRDRATSQLMQRFYAGLIQRRMTPAAALRAAQVSMWKQAQWRAPAYWSAFVVQGDWRPRTR